MSCMATCMLVRRPDGQRCCAPQVVADRRWRWKEAGFEYLLLDESLDLLANRPRSIPAFCDFPPLVLMQVSQILVLPLGA